VRRQQVLQRERVSATRCICCFQNGSEDILN
jgi:hypothetical protein